SDWRLGQTVHFAILRAGQPLAFDITLQALPLATILKMIELDWGNLFVGLFMYLVFLPSMLLIGIVVFCLRPRNPAAQTLLLLCIAFTGQLPFYPFSTTRLNYW